MKGREWRDTGRGVDEESDEGKGEVLEEQGKEIEEEKMEETGEGVRPQGGDPEAGDEHVDLAPSPPGTEAGSRDCGIRRPEEGSGGTRGRGRGLRKGSSSCFSRSSAGSCSSPA